MRGVLLIYYLAKYSIGNNKKSLNGERDDVKVRFFLASLGFSVKLFFLGTISILDEFKELDG